MDIPGYELIISMIDLKENQIRLRLVGDFHPEDKEEAFEVVIVEPAEFSRLSDLLGLCFKKNESIYIWLNESILHVEAESGTSLESMVKSVDSKMVAFSEDELRHSLNKVYSWYLSENEKTRMLHERVRKALLILNETARRVEVKLQSGRKSDTTTTLYSQQMHLINRVIDLLDS